MANPIFKFSLWHKTLGTQVISEPSGWKDAKLKLTRDPEFHSLIEYFEADLIFYGSHGSLNGGIDFIRSVDAIGPDEELIIFIDISVDSGLIFNSLFVGQLDLTGLEERQNNQMAVPIIRNDLWIKFVNRFETPTNIQSTKTIDGNTISVPTPFKLHLTPQLVRKIYSGFQKYNNYDRYNPSFDYGIIDFDSDLLNEIDQKFHYQFLLNDAKPFELFTVLEAGTYTIDCIITLAQRQTINRVTSFSAAGGAGDLVFLQINANTPIPFSRSDRNVNSGTLTLNNGYVLTTLLGIDSSVSDFSINLTVNLNRNDSIRIYQFNTTLALNMMFGNAGWAHEDFSGIENFDYLGNAYDNTNGPAFQGYWDASLNTYPNNGDASVKLGFSWLISTPGVLNGVPVLKNYALQALVDNPGTTAANWWANPKHLYEGIEAYGKSKLVVSAETTYVETSCDSFLIHDTAQYILERTLSKSEVFYSEHFGNSITTPAYAEDGCANGHVLTQGFQLRAVNLNSKPVYMSFADWWKGANPIFNLGLGYDIVNNEEVIRVEQKSFFYDDTMSTLISQIKSIKRTYDTDLLINKIEVGYNKWESLDLSTIDDPQGKHTYSTALHKIDKSISLYSTFVAASLAIETTRRKAVDTTENGYKFDTDVFIVSVKPFNTSPDTYIPELSENFDSIGNLLNSSTRYNLLLTPLRNLLRWGNYLSIGIQTYLNTYPFKFVSGEGNVKMSSDYHATGNPGICLAIIGDTLTENQDILLGSPSEYHIPVGVLHLPYLYTIDIDMTFETYESIRINRQQAIGISQTSSGHYPLFIKELQYDICHSKATITGWSTLYIQITNTEYIAPTNNCSQDYRITEEEDIRLLESGEKRVVN